MLSQPYFIYLMQSPKPTGSSWRRRSFRGHVPLDKYEKARLIEDQDSLSINEELKTPKPASTASPLRSLGDLAIVFVVLLLSETARGIVLPTLSPFVKLIGGDAALLGYAVAAFSMGRFVSTIGLGYLSTRMSYKKVLGGSVAITVVGNLMYSFSYFFGPYFLLASRFITGFGAGTLSVIRAYVAHVTTPQERTSYMSILGAVQFLGFAIMPGAGSLLSFVPEFDIAGAPFDKYTLPGYVVGILSLGLLALILVMFKNPPPLITQVDGPKSTTNTPAVSTNTTPVPDPWSPPQLAHSSPYLSQPAHNSPYLSQPVHNSPLSQPHFPPPPPPYTSPSAFHSAILVSPQPIQPYNPHYHPQFPTHFSPQFIHSPHSPHSPHVSPHSPHILFSPVFQPHVLPHSPQLSPPLLAESPFRPIHPPSSLSSSSTRQIVIPHSPETPTNSPPTTPRSPTVSSSEPPSLTNIQKIIIFGVFLILNLMVRLVLGIIETIATPVYQALNDNKPGKDIEAGFVFGGLGFIGMGVLFLISYLSKKGVKDFTVLVTGLSALVLGSGLLIGDPSLPRFIIGSGFIWCIGYPLAQTIIVSMFSKMLGNKPQGTWMGWIGAMGSLGRIIGPTVAGLLMKNEGQSITFIFGTCVSVFALLTSLVLLAVKTKRPAH